MVDGSCVHAHNRSMGGGNGCSIGSLPKTCPVTIVVVTVQSMFVLHLAWLVLFFLPSDSAAAAVAAAGESAVVRDCAFFFFVWLNLLLPLFTWLRDRLF